MLRLGELIIFHWIHNQTTYQLFEEYVVLGFFACGFFKVIFKNDFEIWKPFILFHSFSFFFLLLNVNYFVLQTFLNILLCFKQELFFFYID